MTYKVLVTCPPMLESINDIRTEALNLGMELTAPKVVQALGEDQLIELLKGHDGWIIGDDPASAHVVDSAKKSGLTAAVKWGIGVDNVDFEAFEEASIPITNTPNMFGDEVADLTMCYLIGLARHAFFIDREVRAGHWPKPAGVSLRGKTVGVLGLGNIGAQFALRAKASGMKVIAWDPYVVEPMRDVTMMSNWPEGLSHCDFLVLTCPLTTDTCHIFGEGALSQLTPGLRLINVSRGQLIDEHALLSGLASGAIGSVALDVFEVEPLENSSPLREYDQCIFGSHNASNTRDAVKRTSTDALQKLFRFLEGK